MEALPDIHSLKEDAKPSQAICCCPKIAALNKPGAKKTNEIVEIKGGRPSHGKWKKVLLKKKKEAKKTKIGIVMELLEATKCRMEWREECDRAILGLA